MYEQEEIKPYHDGGKAQQVEQMFDHIAPTYDKLNHRLSWDIDKGWRRKAIKQLEPFRPQTLLDIATGTGDFAILSAQILKPTRLIGADISEGMMDIGRQKVKKEGLDQIISFAKEDCLNLSYADDTFDAVTAAFGIRNFADLDKGLQESDEIRWALEHRGTDFTRQFSHETAVPHLCTHRAPCLRTAHQQGHQRL